MNMVRRVLTMLSYAIIATVAYSMCFLFIETAMNPELIGRTYPISNNTWASSENSSSIVDLICNNKTTTINGYAIYVNQYITHVVPFLYTMYGKYMVITAACIMVYPPLASFLIVSGVMFFAIGHPIMFHMQYKIDGTMIVGNHEYSFNSYDMMMHMLHEHSVKSVHINCSVMAIPVGFAAYALMLSIVCISEILFCMIRYCKMRTNNYGIDHIYHNYLF